MAKPGGIADTLIQQQRQSASIPPIVSMPPIATSTGVREIKRLVLPLAANTSTPIILAGNFIQVESIRETGAGRDIFITGLLDPLTVKPDTSNVAFPITAAGLKIPFPTDYNSLTIVNPATNPAVTLVIWVGFGGYDAPVKQVGPLETSFVSSGGITSAAAYVAGDAIGSGPFTMAGFFQSGLFHAKISRAKLVFAPQAPAAFDVLLLMWNGNCGLTPGGSFVDHTQIVVPNASIDFMLSPLRFPVQQRDGGSLFSYCDLTDIFSELISGTTDNQLMWQLVAMTPLALTNPTGFSLNLTAGFNP